MSEIAIEVRQLYKAYKIYNKPVDRLKEVVFPFGKKRHTKLRVLRYLTFKVYKGESVGIIGINGSGKSTLLKIITGVLTPTSGAIAVNGKISALLELGAAFNMELTGLENIYLHGTMNGLSRAETEGILKDIIEFADIGEFINQPAKIYSSGMFVRLAFAAAIHVNPDILIIDEALSVGDMRFQQKCLRKIEEFKRDKTVIFVSHDLDAINKFCGRAIWLNNGVIEMDGAPEEVIKGYQAYTMSSSLQKFSYQTEDNNSAGGSSKYEIDPIAESLDMAGDHKAMITGISILDKAGHKASLFYSEEKVKLLIRVHYASELNHPIVGFTLKDRLGNIVLQSNTYVLRHFIERVVTGKEYICSFEFILPPLKSGIYSISPAIASGTQEDHVQHCWIHDAQVIQVLDRRNYDLQGFVYLNDVLVEHYPEGGE